MAPNLLVATQTLFQPRKWFRQQKSPKSQRMTEHWELPVPGLYEYIPSRGWYLIEKDIVADTSEVSTKGESVLTIEQSLPKDTKKQNPPVAVRYSKVLKRYLLAPDYQLRRKVGVIENSHGKLISVTFFRLDDGVSWVNFLDEHGEFIPGPYRLWVMDDKTEKFRHMLRRDDPEYHRSQSNSRTHSRQSSVENDALRRHSQESRSTEYRSGGPGSNRDGQSCPSTRTSSIKGFPSSKPSSNAPSRRGSLSRGLPSPRIPLDEAGAALRKLQKERAAKDAAAKPIADDSAAKESEMKADVAAASDPIVTEQPAPNVDHSQRSVVAVGA